MRQVAEDLGVKVSVLYEWRHRLAPRPGGETRAPRTLEEATAAITRLRTELGRMHERENMLKNRWTFPPKRPGAGCSGRGHEWRAYGGGAVPAAAGHAQRVLPLAALAPEPARDRGRGAGRAPRAVPRSLQADFRLARIV